MTPMYSHQVPKVAFYWCASCGGCEETVIDLNAAFLAIAGAVEIVFWPAAMDFKYHHVEAMADGEIAVSFINGAIRTEEQARVAALLRQKSALVVAFGSCAHTGGIPGLANLSSRDQIIKTSFLEAAIVDNPHQVVPKTKSEIDGVEATLPELWSQVHSLGQLLAVDYYLPGCPPTPELLAAAVQAILKAELPQPGTVLAPTTALCDSCHRRQSRDPKHKISRIYRPHEIQADPEVCFLQQGIICCGPATRGGCGESCINGNMPCTGCFGPPPGVVDQGAKMLSAIASLLEADSRQEAEEKARGIVDPAGTFYRYALPTSLIGCKITEGDS